MDVYIKDEKNNINFRCPVNPFKTLSKESERRFKTGDIINYGEVDIYKTGENIEEISFDTLFPKEYNESFCKYADLKDPQSTVNMFEKWVLQEEPLRLIITDININMLVNISKFKQTHNAGEIGDVYATLSFRRHREITIEKVQSSSVGQQLYGRSTVSSDYKKGDKIKVNEEIVSLYDGNGAHNKEVGMVKKGKILEIYRVYNGWADCLYGNSGGWIDLSKVVKA